MGWSGKVYSLGHKHSRAEVPRPLRFDAARAEIEFDALYLGLPLRGDEKALLNISARTLHRH